MTLFKDYRYIISPNIECNVGMGMVWCSSKVPKFAYSCTAFCTPDECRTTQREAAKRWNSTHGCRTTNKTIMSAQNVHRGHNSNSKRGASSHHQQPSASSQVRREGWITWLRKSFSMWTCSHTCSYLSQMTQQQAINVCKPNYIHSTRLSFISVKWD